MNADQIVDLKASMLVQDQGYATLDIDRMLRLPVKNEEPDRELLAKLSCAECSTVLTSTAWRPTRHPLRSKTATKLW